ncbi:retrovirus-related pol polyprotein from transposon TNT 1-94 [Tanacetum coccineum]|uniref:Retrovirus-related pol polyprotein from transposon TNT 1-94 n=1 Tax=Tanacetum coccineum TaxID=301880 RepID=A0ABQ4ZRJ1_9ASTR
MSNLSKLEFNAFDVTEKNYMPWVLDVKMHLESMRIAQTIVENNDSPPQDKVRANIFLRKHIDNGLKFEYFTTEDPSILWKDLKDCFNNQMEVLLPVVREEWGSLRFQDFKKVNEYVGENLLHISCIKHDRLQKFTRYSDLNDYLLVAEQNNELLMKNHQSRLTGSLAYPEVNATKNDTKSFMCGLGQSHGKGRGQFGKINSHGHNCSFDRNKKDDRVYTRGRGFTHGSGQRTNNYVAQNNKAINVGKRKHNGESGPSQNTDGSCLRCEKKEGNLVDQLDFGNNVLEKLLMLHSGLHYTHHDRLGHPGSTMMKRIVESTHGHPLKDRKILQMDKMAPCTSCSLGKLIARPSPLKVEKESLVFLERIQGNICGLIHPPCGPLRYFMVLIDASSRWSHVSLLLTRNVAFAKFLAQIIKLRAHFPDYTVKRVRLDNAGEFSLCLKHLMTVTKMGPQRRLGIYVGYETISIIRYLEPSTGDVFTTRFADCHFNEAIFPSLGGEKKNHEKDVLWSEPSLLYLDPHTKQSEAEKFCYNVACDIVNGNDDPEPTSVIECQTRQDWNKWKEAMQPQLNSLNKRKVFGRIVLTPEVVKLVGYKWVFIRKRNENDKVIRYKARLIAQGFSQRPGIDYEETYSSVMDAITFRYLFSLAIYENLNMRLMDVVTAYLYRSLDSDIYMKILEGFKMPEALSAKPKDMYSVKLQRSLYGLKQFGCMWYNRLIVYVDDLNIIGTNKEINEFVVHLKEEFEMKDLGKTKYCLGLQIEHMPNGVLVHQSIYTEKILKRFNMDKAKSLSTPMVGRSLNVDDDPFRSCEKMKMFLVQKYHISVQLELNCTRPDISFAVNLLARFSSSPTKRHWNGIKHIFRYLRGTTDLGFFYSNNSKQGLVGYADARYLSDPH